MDKPSNANPMRLFIQPVDVWLFRDGKPFNAESDHLARGIFPPYPSMMQGVIRSQQLVVEGVDLADKTKIEQAVGSATHFGELRMQGPYLARLENQRLVRYFPLPAHAAPNKNEKFKAILPQSISAQTSANTVFASLLPPHDVEPSKKDFGSWLSEESLRQCLRGEEVTAVRNSDFFSVETRTGIGMDHERRSTRQGLLYEAQCVRMKASSGLCVDVAGYAKWPDSGVLRMGGEGHAGLYKQYLPPESPRLHSNPSALPRNFVLYFASPSYFDQGWTPSNWNHFFEGEVALQTAAIHKYETIGGFDWARGTQKTARRFVAAGSSYFFSHNGAAKIRSDLIQNAITHFGAEIGFGQVFVAEWDK